MYRYVKENQKILYELILLQAFQLVWTKEALIK